MTAGLIASEIVSIRRHCAGADIWLFRLRVSESTDEYKSLSPPIRRSLLRSRSLRVLKMLASRRQTIL